jgi:hypothetical protein
MTIELLQNDYQELFREASESNEPSHCSDGFDKICQFPKQLGQGYSRVIRLREGLELAIDDYQLRDRLIVKSTRSQTSSRVYFLPFRRRTRASDYRECRTICCLW